MEALNAIVPLTLYFDRLSYDYYIDWLLFHFAE